MLSPMSSRLFLAFDLLIWLWLKLSKFYEYISDMLYSTTSSRRRVLLMLLLLMCDPPIEALSKSSG
jgi:hypothetical protein